jgi:myo-inositol-1(or 4)-monophosphatase
MLAESEQRNYLARIEGALRAATAIANRYVPGTFLVSDNGGRDVITEVDRKVSDILRVHLLEPSEGWLSEEDRDDKVRLDRKIVWVVDPLDGTREFVDGIPEWCISIGLVVDGIAIAGGICNPATDELFLGSLDCGVSYNGRSARVSTRSHLDGAVVLASRQEYKRGEWKCFEQLPFTVRATGSVAYKLALVAAGRADATWTLSPKHEWDVAAGVALVTAAGGVVGCTENAELQFNRDTVLFPGLAASSRNLWPEVARLIARTPITP